MNTPLRVLIVDDSEDDAILLLRELRRGGYDPISERVDTPESMSEALDRQAWDIVLSDYAIPCFTIHAAIAMVHQKGLDIPYPGLAEVLMHKACAHYKPTPKTAWYI